MRELARVIGSAAEAADFSGAVQVDSHGETVVALARGYADRAHHIPNEISTRFGLASGTKGLTALAVVSLITEGAFELSTGARSLLGSDLPLVDDRVTVEHLLAHRSGIGDYLDENEDVAINDYLLPVPAQKLDSTEGYLAVLDGHPQKDEPGTRFSYCNSGYVILALLAERATGVAFMDLVRTCVCEPAGMASTAFLRSDQLPGDVAIGYVTVDDVSRSNVFHLPVLGSGDGGIASTVGDVHRLWTAFLSGRLVPSTWVETMLWPRSVTDNASMRYGLGFWLDGAGPAVMLEGCDAGVSFRSVHDPDSDLTWTVVSNTTSGAWPVARAIDAHLRAAGGRGPA